MTWVVEQPGSSLLFRHVRLRVIAERFARNVRTHCVGCASFVIVASQNISGIPSTFLDALVWTSVVQKDYNMV